MNELAVLSGFLGLSYIILGALIPTGLICIESDFFGSFAMMNLGVSLLILARLQKEDKRKDGVK